MVTNIIGFKNINLAKGPKATFCGCQILDVSIWRMSNIVPVQPQIKHSEASLYQWVDILQHFSCPLKSMSCQIAHNIIKLK